MIPRVSIIVPCFNAAKFVGQALDSARGQTCAEIEIIAVDDGSTDGTRAVLEAHAARDGRVRVIAQPNRGESAARNAGLRHAAAEYICFLDADDVLLPDKVERQAAFLDRTPECDLVYSDYLMADAALNLWGYVRTRIPDSEIIAHYARRNWFGVMAPLLRRSAAERVGEFDEALTRAADWDFWIRCARVCRFEYLEGAVAVYRHHDSQVHRGAAEMVRGARAVIAKHFGGDARLRSLALSCLYWSAARDRFRARALPATAWYTVASEFRSLLAGGVPFSVRNVDTVILAVPAEAELAVRRQREAAAS